MSVKGQTMIEVVVALTLIIMFLSGVVIIELYAIRNTEYARNKSVSTRLARQQIERARVVRDAAGVDALGMCLSTCFINNQLTPIPITPTGVFAQSLVIISAELDDCPLETAGVTPAPFSYKATAKVSWSQGAVNITPAPEVEVSSCITDWR